MSPITSCRRDQDPEQPVVAAYRTDNQNHSFYGSSKLRMPAHTTCAGINVEKLHRTAKPRSSYEC